MTTNSISSPANNGMPPPSRAREPWLRASQLAGRVEPTKDSHCLCQARQSIDGVSIDCGDCPGAKSRLLAYFAAVAELIRQQCSPCRGFRHNDTDSSCYIMGEAALPPSIFNPAQVGERQHVSQHDMESSNGHLLWFCQKRAVAQDWDGFHSLQRPLTQPVVVFGVARGFTQAPQDVFCQFPADLLGCGNDLFRWIRRPLLGYPVVQGRVPEIDQRLSLRMRNPGVHPDL